MSRLNQDIEQARRFLSLLDDGETEFTFQTFDDSKNRKLPALAQVFHGTLEEHIGRLKKLNDQGAGVFVTVNATDGKGRKKENIIRIRAVWQEADRSDVPGLPIEPDIIVESSPGKHHRYVLTDTTNVDEFEAVQERLVADYGSDPAAKDRARVLRLPGFYHRKGKPHMVSIVTEKGEPPMAWDEVKKLFPPVVRKASRPNGAGGEEITPSTISDINNALDKISPDCGYGEWLNVGMALHAAFSGGSKGLDLWDGWSTKGKKWRDGECAYRWGTFNGGGVTLGTLFHMAGVKPSGQRLNNGHEEAGNVSSLDEARERKKSHGRAASNANGDLSAPTFGETLNWLRNKAWVRHNEFDMCIEYRGRRIADHDVSAMREAAELEGLNVSYQKMMHAVDLVAAECAYDPLKDYLNGLKWDGTERLNNMLSDALGAEQSDYTAEIGKRFMVGGAERGLNPGCVHRIVPVLMGLQNLGKSQFCRALSPNPDWFSDNVPKDLGDKAASEAVMGKWIIEWAEMASAKRNEVEMIKSFISRQDENFRPAYGRHKIRYPRRCFLIGTTNEDTPLPTDDENTRFWPIRATEYNRDYMEANRDQLWAEAVHFMKSGFVWWDLPDTLRAKLASERKDAQAADEWTAILERAVVGTNEYTTEELARQVLGIQTDRLDLITQKRISKGMRAIGWASKQLRSGPKKGQRVWTLPVHF